jgi:hypothetical protein
VSRRTLVAGGLGAAGTLLLDEPAEAARARHVRILHASCQFSDTRAEHAHDARAIFAHARRSGIELVSGTEAGGNSLSWQIPKAARAHGYAIELRGGDWVAVDREFGIVDRRGYVPVYAGLSRPARLGGHGPRGITWIRVRPRDRRIAPAVFYGSSHWLTRRSLRASGLRSNRRLARAVGRWAADHGRGDALVFYAADVNEDDRRRDVFARGPLTTCWDELRKWPATRSSGRTIDVIASLDWDDRVSCSGARRLDDRDLFLFSDHAAIEAGYRVRLRS